MTADERLATLEATLADLTERMSGFEHVLAEWRSLTEETAAGREAPAERPQRRLTVVRASHPAAGPA